jgi:hypothetical protein
VGEEGLKEYRISNIEHGMSKYWIVLTLFLVFNTLATTISTKSEGKIHYNQQKGGTKVTQDIDYQYFVFFVSLCLIFSWHLNLI